MKKNFCKVLAMVIAAIMMMSVAAFADIDTPAVSEEIATITISGLTTGEEATILVLNAGTDPATLADDDTNIIYIDQTTVADGKVTFTVDASAAATAEDGKKYVDIYSGYSSMTGDPFKLANVLISKVEDPGPVVPDPDPEPVTVEYGNVNGDEDIDTVDAGLVLQFYAKSITSFPVENGDIIANVNGDEDIDTVDAGLILQFYAKTLDKFPVEK